MLARLSMAGALELGLGLGEVVCMEVCMVRGWA